MCRIIQEILHRFDRLRRVLSVLCINPISDSRIMYHIIRVTMHRGKSKSTKHPTTRKEVEV